jgi:hypothetical protein
MSNCNHPPDFTLWEDNLFNLNNHRQNSSSGLDDATIVDFYDNQISIKYDAKGLLDILQNNLSPLTEEQCEQLQTFLRTPKEEGKPQLQTCSAVACNQLPNFPFGGTRKLKSV